MKKTLKTGLILIVIVVIVLLVSKRLTTNSARDTIVFLSPTEIVVDSLVVMDKFINNMSMHLEKKSGYRIDKGRFYNDLYIGGKKITNLDKVRESMKASIQTKDSLSVDVKANDIFNALTDENLTRFINLAVFLDDNYISSSSLSKYYNTNIFGYRDTLIYDDEDVRDIVLLETITDTTQFLEEIKVFDRRNGLVLFSPYK